MKGPTALLEVGQDGVAVITLKNAPVNALHPQVLEAFFDHLRQAQAAPQVKAIVVRGAGGVFCAGFDIAQFAKPTSGNFSVEVNKAFVQLLEDGPKPVVAAIEKTALGGGCELALACHGRICAPGCQLGLPELTLGILPGFGGTQRLPRAVGLQKALEMILTSKPIKCKEARKLGLVDDIVAAEGLLEAAKKLALDMAAGRKPFMRTLYRTDKLESLADALQVLQLAEAETKRRAKDLQHPLMALEAVRHGVMYGGLSGIQKEAEVFEAARSLDAHKALVHIFFAQRQTKKVSGVTDGGLKPRPMRRVAVLGGGLMGSGIATALTMAGVEVLLKEVDRRFLDAGLGRIRQNLASRVKKGALSEQAAEEMMARVTGTLEYGGFGSVDMVIEAVIENVALKQRIFADLERHCRPDAILASNTSTISIDVVGNTCRPDTRSRIVGAHFFSPAHVMPLLEVVRSQSTSKQVVLDTLSLGVAIKKTPVVVGNCTGFAVNRVFFPYTMAACMLADAGVDPLAVDRAIAGVFQMPMGPFRLTDLVGADIGLHVAANFVDSFPERVYRSKLILLLNEAKMLGEKTGKGFYSYDSKRRASANPAVKPMVQQSQRAAGLLAAAGGKPLVMSPQDIIEFLFFPVVNEGCRVVAESIVDKPADLDVASVMAMGFPAFRGGIIFWGDLVGAARIVERLESWATMFPAHAGFFRPCEYLKTAAQQGRKLGAGVVGSPRM